MINTKEYICIALDINECGAGFSYTSDIESALSKADLDIKKLDETIESVKSLKPDCDIVDYSLSASSGALCGLLDIFLIGRPGESPIGNITDKWFENRTCDFARICGWNGNEQNSTKSAVSFLERKFKVPYDQRGCGDSGGFVFDLNPSNHHFKSLAHNPSLLGLFFSILDQFTNSSHFVSNGQLVELVNADDKFYLRGNSVLGKLWCGFANWIGHLVSDISGASGSVGRGMGIPSPLWTWINSLVAIKTKFNIPVNQFDEDVSNIALNLFKEGYDVRFQSAQVIPVLINELFVRLFYSIRRLIKYYSVTDKKHRSFKDAWSVCKPLNNVTIKRMLTVAHGTFCLVDIADATIRGFVSSNGSFNPIEFFLRLNIVGVGRLTISLYGETKREINYHKVKKEALFAKREKTILKYYIDGLNVLKEKYDDKEYLSFIEDLKESECIKAFVKTIELARKRNVPESNILSTKEDIDKYFNSKK